jgi:uncharacterized membrane-anchored protein
MPNNTASRPVVGKAMLASSVVMLVLAALYWFRVLPLPDSLVPLVSAVLFVAGVIDGIVGLRFLGE